MNATAEVDFVPKNISRVEIPHFGVEPMAEGDPSRLINRFVQIRDELVKIPQTTVTETPLMDDHGDIYGYTERVSGMIGRTPVVVATAHYKGDDEAVKTIYASVGSEKKYINSWIVVAEGDAPTAQAPVLEGQKSPPPNSADAVLAIDSIADNLVSLMRL